MYTPATVPASVPDESTVPRRPAARLVPVLVTGALMCMCSGGGPGADVAGNTSEVGNGKVMGVVRYASGAPASGAVVRCVPDDYRPVDSASVNDTFPSVITDDSGRYELPSLLPRLYTIEAELDSLAGFVRNVDAAEGTLGKYAPDAVLGGTGAVAGYIVIEGLENLPRPRSWAYIEGTSRRALPEAGGRFFIDGIPAGEHQLMVEPWSSGYYRYLFDITVVEGDTLVMDTVRIDKVL